MRRSVSIIVLALAATAGRGEQFPVTPEVGPWMICVTSYSGDTAGQLAEALVTSLRQDYRVAAFTFNRGAEERARERERIEALKRRQREYLRSMGVPEDVKVRGPKTYRIEDQFAVLIGGYKDMDAARQALEAVRKLPPPPEKLRHAAIRNENGQEHTVTLNPFQAAFVVRNPTAPAPKPEAPKLENLREYNADESYSLLKCGKPWTLVVKSFQGATALQSGTANAAMLRQAGLTKGQLLNAAGNQAHSLAELLRKAGFPAYVLHTENVSYVTVGGFDRPDDPKLLQLQEAFTHGQTGYFPSLRQNNLLMARPMPMAVPEP